MSPTTPCRLCGVPIRPCNCGANHGKPHWSSLGERGSRHCAGKNQPHEPAFSEPDYGRAS